MPKAPVLIIVVPTRSYLLVPVFDWFVIGFSVVIDVDLRRERALKNQKNDLLPEALPACWKVCPSCERAGDIRKSLQPGADHRDDRAEAEANYDAALQTEAMAA